jgi:uncharacterized protein HemX
MVSTKTKTKNIILLTLVSTAFILSVASYATPQIQQQAFAQGMFETQQQSDLEGNQTSSSLSNQTSSSLSSSPITGEEVSTEEDGDVPGLATNQSATEDDQKLVLGDITIPITSNTTLSLEMPDSKITIQPNK